MDLDNKAPVIWKLSALHLEQKILISGVILSDVPFNYDKPKSLLKNFLLVLKSYFIDVYANKKIVITLSDKTISTTTDNYGGFSVLINLQGSDDLSIRRIGYEEPLPVLQKYPIHFHKTRSPFDIISDIDDTIIVSYTANFFKRIRALAFTPPLKRKSVGFIKKLFQEVEKDDVRVHYVSKSESNLFAMLTAIIAHHKLPEGNLILTPYLKLRQLLNPKKGRDYKLQTIRLILSNTGTKKYVLLGDDSQKDMEVYSEIIEEFPDRIVRVYIRQTKHRIHTNQKKKLERLKLTGLPIIYFHDDTEIDVRREYQYLTKELS